VRRATRRGSLGKIPKKAQVIGGEKRTLKKPTPDSSSRQNITRSQMKWPPRSQDGRMSGIAEESSRSNNPFRLGKRKKKKDLERDGFLRTRGGIKPDGYESHSHKAHLLSETTNDVGSSS